MLDNNDSSSSSIPTQLNENVLIDWNNDIIWDILNGNTSSIVIRHRLCLASETFTDLDIIFNDDNNDAAFTTNKNDHSDAINANTSNWTKWLLTAGIHHHYHHYYH